MHPLNSLRSDELLKTTKLIKDFDSTVPLIFNSICLKEPRKEVILTWNPNSDPIDRVSFAILIDQKSGQVYEAEVNLTTNQVERFTTVENGKQPTLTPEDCFEAERIAKSNSEVQERCAKLGFKDMNLVVGDPWSAGYLGDKPELTGKRIVQLFMYARNFDGDNHYAHPLDFLVVTDIIAGKVVSIETLPSNEDELSKDPVKVPLTPRNYDPEFLDPNSFRTDLKPLTIIQEQGPSFAVNGNEIEWQKFKMRISFNYREGLVLHQVAYKDGSIIRPLIYRASLVEMAVPYCEPKIPFHRKCAFDIGDYGLGFCTNTLELGCDCLGAIKYFDAVLNKHDGSPFTIKNAICLHEEDDGVLFKHSEYRTGKSIVTRKRKLVLSFIVTVVNYEYGFYWYFSQDGTISFEVKATGELSTNLWGNSNPIYGTIVGKNILAQYHQHIFSMRLNMMIDGIQNTVSVVDTKSDNSGIGSKNNFYGQGFHLEETTLETSLQSRTRVYAENSRIWKISSNKINEITEKPTAWKLMPFGNYSRLLARPESFIGQKAGFANYSVWVTPFHEDQKFPSGFYVLNKDNNYEDDGIVKWTSKNESIVDKDIVIWHTFGMTHIPRVEDFPIMNTESSGFMLKPFNFFNSNPGIDIPAPTKNVKNPCCGSE